MIPLIIFLSYKMGALWLGSNATSLHFNKSYSLETASINFFQYVYGSITLAILAALVFGTGTYLFLSLFRKSNQEKQ